MTDGLHTVTVVNLQKAILANKQFCDSINAETIRKSMEAKLNTATGLNVANIEKDFLPPDSYKTAVTELTTAPFTPVALNITLDDSQLDAVDSIKNTQYNVLIGSAGTGKTTVVKQIINDLMEENKLVTILDSGHRKGTLERENIAFCAFTGVASFRLAQSVPPELRRNVSTIHMLLEVMPMDCEVVTENGETKLSKRFLPMRGMGKKIPLDYIVIDESGMLDVTLWNWLAEALPDHCKIILIGDIAQLPAVIGKSVLGYALAAPQWKTSCLTKIHRQALDNPIIANAHAIREGRMPVDSGSRFRLFDIGSMTDNEKALYKAGKLPKDFHYLKNTAESAQKIITKMLEQAYTTGSYNPETDKVICPMNVGPVGAIALNQVISAMVNPKAIRTLVQVSYKDTVSLCIGDKMIFTENNYYRGHLNGTLCTVIDIAPNPKFLGVVKGAVGETATATAEEEEALWDSIDTMSLDFDSVADEVANTTASDFQAEKEMQASHTLTVAYEDAFTKSPRTLTMSTTGEVGKLLLSYAMTCHKCQGSEFRNVFVIVHESSSKMHTREWLYTAVTRAKENCFVVYNDRRLRGLRACVSRQAVKGDTIEEKCRNFSETTGANGKVNKIDEVLRINCKTLKGNEI